MILALFIVSLLVSAVCVRHSFTHHKRVNDYHIGGRSLVPDFFAWVRMSISMISITLTLLVSTVAELVFSDIPKTAEYVSAVTFLVLGVSALIISKFDEASVAATAAERGRTDSRVKVKVGELDMSETRITS